MGRGVLDGEAEQRLALHGDRVAVGQRLEWLEVEGRVVAVPRDPPGAARRVSDR